MENDIEIVRRGYDPDYEIPQGYYWRYRGGDHTTENGPFYTWDEARNDWLQWQAD